uniref:Beta-hairpin-type antibacterial peptide n=1 Tax=Drosophila virilis TaxID=7244 RepID=A0A0A7BZ30_DROVI|nr:beta-hairpin-type antibacterial peptide [Drosophila virilis]
MILSVLAMLTALALAQPVTPEPTELKDPESNDGQEVDQAEIDSAGPSDVEAAVAQLLRQEAARDVAATESHSRQKRAVCRCYRRARNAIVCYCR